MIFEKLKFSFDIEALQKHLHQNVLIYPPLIREGSIGGWSVLSSNGSYLDGWHKTGAQIQGQMDTQSLAKAIANSGGLPPAAYNRPTEICHGVLKNVMDTFIQAQLRPLRARITKLIAGKDCPWHRDAPDSFYCARVHVPLVTNPGCFFETREGQAHLPADGSSYILFVNKEHRVVNLGDTDRYHLIMDVTDAQGVSEFHNLPLFTMNSKKKA